MNYVSQQWAIYLVRSFNYDAVKNTRSANAGKSKQWVQFDDSN